MKYKDLQGMLSLKFLENKRFNKFSEKSFMEFMTFSKQLENLDILVNGLPVDSVNIDFKKETINLEVLLDE